MYGENFVIVAFAQRAIFFPRKLTRVLPGTVGVIDSSPRSIAVFAKYIHLLPSASRNECCNDRFREKEEKWESGF